jgi:hypothetical protein
MTTFLHRAAPQHQSGLDSSSRMKDWSRVGLDRSRPILSRHFAQALHFSPRTGLKGLAGMLISKGPDLAAAWRKTMPVTTIFRRAAEIRIARSIYDCVAALATLIIKVLYRVGGNAKSWHDAHH